MEPLCLNTVTVHPIRNKVQPILLVVLSCPRLFWVVGLEHHLAPAVEHTELVRASLKTSPQRKEGIVDAIVVWGERIGDIQVEFHRHVLGCDDLHRNIGQIQRNQG